MRLDRLSGLEECRSLLTPLDKQGLLAGVPTPATEPVELIDDDELLAELECMRGASDITELRYVRTAADKRAAEEIANRTPCEDFDNFKPLFVQVKKGLDAGIRQTRRFQTMAEIKEGEFFIVGGQIAYVAGVGKEFLTEYDRRDSRLRVIYDNGTESDVLLRSLQRALHRDEAGRRITDPTAGPLFSGESEDGDLASGTIYVLRSKSDHPTVAAHRDVLHKIGVTGGDIARRIASAKQDPTFLLADVEVIATYELFNVNRTRLENLIHRVFDSARLDIEIKDRFGQPVIPREWFLVPLFVVNEAVDRIRDGTITDYLYERRTAALVRADKTKGMTTVNEINHEKRNRLIKARIPKSEPGTSVAGAPVPGERERDLARLAKIKNRRHPTKRSTPPGKRAAARRKLLKRGRGKK